MTVSLSLRGSGAANALLRANTAISECWACLSSDHICSLHGRRATEGRHFIVIDTAANCECPSVTAQVRSCIPTVFRLMLRRTPRSDRMEVNATSDHSAHSTGPGGWRGCCSWLAAAVASVPAAAAARTAASSTDRKTECLFVDRHYGHPAYTKPYKFNSEPASIDFPASERACVAPN
jgi:hypothetical protein